MRVFAAILTILILLAAVLLVSQKIPSGDEDGMEMIGSNPSLADANYDPELLPARVPIEVPTEEGFVERVFSIVATAGIYYSAPPLPAAEVVIYSEDGQTVLGKGQTDSLGHTTIRVLVGKENQGDYFAEGTFGGQSSGKRKIPSRVLDMGRDIKLGIDVISTLQLSMMATEPTSFTRVVISFRHIYSDDDSKTGNLSAQLEELGEIPIAIKVPPLRPLFVTGIMENGIGVPLFPIIQPLQIGEERWESVGSLEEYQPEEFVITLTSETNVPPPGIPSLGRVFRLWAIDSTGRVVQAWEKQGYLPMKFNVAIVGKGTWTFVAGGSHYGPGRIDIEPEQALDNIQLFLSRVGKQILVPAGEGGVPIDFNRQPEYWITGLNDWVLGYVRYLEDGSVELSGLGEQVERVRIDGLVWENHVSSGETARVEWPPDSASRWIETRVRVELVGSDSERVRLKFYSENRSVAEFMCRSIDFLPAFHFSSSLLLPESIEEVRAIGVGEGEVWMVDQVSWGQSKTKRILDVRISRKR